MQNFQGNAFIWTRTYSEIFKSAFSFQIFKCLYYSIARGINEKVEKLDIWNHMDSILKQTLRQNLKPLLTVPP